MTEHALLGAWRALGLTASPRTVVGEGISFVCFCGAWRVDVSERSAKCSHCGFEASGEPWEIAAAFAKRKENGAPGKGLPIRSFYEIDAYVPDPQEEIWPGGILSMGQPASIVGAPGIGKSRIILQAAICTVLGLPFIDFPTHGAGLKWLFLQTENSMRRLQKDLRAMMSQFGKPQRDAVNECIGFLDIGAKDFTSIYMTEGHPDRVLIAETLEARRPDIVAIDPMRDVTSGDLNSDVDMTAACQGIKKTLGSYSTKATPFCLHHGRTGTVEASKVFGGDAGSFARNSKVFYGWLRSQINVASAGANHEGTVIFGCGKCSDGPQWDAFAAKLDPATMLYHRVEKFNFDEWIEDMNEQAKKGKGSAKPRFSKDQMLACLPGDGVWVSATEWFKLAEQAGCAKATFYSMVAKMAGHPMLENEGKIFRRKP